ncbi:MAG: hypothetical protein LBE25_13610 [Arthrobacter sp.]|jgi:hypothetical protein|nr:hypothetical protein [Arthrobacter sp.]
MTRRRRIDPDAFGVVAALGFFAAFAGVITWFAGVRGTPPGSALSAWLMIVGMVVCIVFGLVTLILRRRAR